MSAGSWILVGKVFRIKKFFSNQPRSPIPARIYTSSGPFLGHTLAEILKKRQAFIRIWLQKGGKICPRRPASSRPVRSRQKTFPPHLWIRNDFLSQHSFPESEVFWIKSGRPRSSPRSWFGKDSFNQNRHFDWKRLLRFRLQKLKLYFRTPCSWEYRPPK